MKIELSEEDKDILALDYIPEHRMAKSIVDYLSAEDKEIAEKAANKIVEEHGETLRRLGDE